MWNKKKYGNKRVSRDGYSFASQLEASVHELLKMRLLAGEITEIVCQKTVYLTDAQISYRADFCCTKPDGSEFYVEAKGFQTAEWNIKKRLWAIYGPAPLEIWMGSHRSPKLTETIVPINHEANKKVVARIDFPQ